MKRTRRKNLTPDEIKQIRDLWLQGLKRQQISEKTGLKYSLIGQWVTSFNKGFNSSAKYQYYSDFKRGSINYQEEHVIPIPQRFEDLIHDYPILKLHYKINQQKNCKVAHFYELDPHELIPKLLNKLEKVKTFGKINLIDVIKKHYFQAKTFKEIGDEKGVDRQDIHQLNNRALSKLREIIQRTEFSEMF